MQAYEGSFQDVAQLSKVIANNFEMIEISLSNILCCCAAFNLLSFKKSSFVFTAVKKEKRSAWALFLFLF